MGRSKLCSRCKNEKEANRDNESYCKACKSHMGKLRRKRLRAEAGLPEWRPGRKQECSRCGKPKGDTSNGYCKPCDRERAKEYRVRKGINKGLRNGLCKCGEKIASYHSYLCSCCASEWKRRYYEKNPDKKIGHRKTAAENQKRKNGYRKKLRARRILRSAVDKGDIERGSCEVCGQNESIEAHHHDYDKPLDVQWLCRKHHAEIHKLIKEI